MSSAARHTSSIPAQVVFCGAVLKAKRIVHTLQTPGAHMADNTAAIVGGYVVPIAGEPIDGATVLIEDGKIAAVGVGLDIPTEVKVIDAGGKWILPGFIEAHGHVGVHEEGE